MKKQLLILLCKYPTIGKVKTRLGKERGMAHAYAFHHACVEQLISTHSKQNYEFQVGLQPAGQIQTFANLFDITAKGIFGQPKADLGTIMHHALKKGLETHEQVILVGSDTPLLSAQEVQQAFEHLEHNDVVLGPSSDCGYYLIGTKTPLDEVLQNMVYSTNTVLTQTKQRLANKKLSYNLLSEKSDIDTYTDLKKSMIEDMSGRFKHIHDKIIASNG